MRESLKIPAVVFAMIFLIAVLSAIAFFLYGPEDGLVTTPDLAPDEYISSYTPSVQYYPAKQWKKALEPEMLGWSSEKLEKAREYFKQLKSVAAMVIENGIIVAEWGDTTNRYKIHSMRKSILSALFGIAVAQGQVDISSTLQELGIDDVPPALTVMEKQARVSDLLKARSGIYHEAAYETSSMRKKRPARGSHAPGTFWYYNNWDFNALSTIYQKTTGSDMFEAFERQISDPLQMQDFRLKDTEYYRSSVSRHPAYLFRMSSRDLARFGLLYLRQGRWKDKQVLQQDWVKQSTTSYSDTRKKGRYSGYGYLWWVGEAAMVAAGKGGQRVFVLPEKNIVFVHLVDTNVRGNKVKGKKITRLLKLVLEAKSRQHAIEGKS